MAFNKRNAVIGAVIGAVIHIFNSHIGTGVDLFTLGPHVEEAIIFTSMGALIGGYFKR